MALLMRGAGAKFFQPGPHGGLALGRISDKRGGAAAEGRGQSGCCFCMFGCALVGLRKACLLAAGEQACG
ncbi:hypothetical protein BRN51_14815 [Xanthomonas oryzae pv. oryzae]|nr:hypothetical protein BRN51_14815 [Xanthomonas oryzae pv. oryzae]RBF81173.1 hypothetical protein BRM95_22105 [Xanthomonas oryzae pv. oryzae]RBK63277.1 hypothetical protein BRN49_13725 [Xanthomonas oryzae pv. oryzae]